MTRLLIAAFSAILFSACNGGNDAGPNDDNNVTGNGIAAPALINYNVIAVHPHDTGAYTQGLEFHNGKLFESTGDFASSSLRVTDFKTGQVLQQNKMGTATLFGEGITILKGKIYQLTWQNHQVFVYDSSNIQKVVKTLSWPYEGWGITNDGTNLIISDGTSNLYTVEPDSFRVLKTISVMDNSGPVKELNELEMIDGFIYANIYYTNDIIKIDPLSGHVVGKITTKALLEQKDVVPERTNVMNGIAYDSVSKTMFITGKRWPKLFELRLN